MSIEDEAGNEGVQGHKFLILQNDLVERLNGTLRGYIPLQFVLVLDMTQLDGEHPHGQNQHDGAEDI